MSHTNFRVRIQYFDRQDTIQEYITIIFFVLGILGFETPDVLAATAVWD